MPDLDRRDVYFEFTVIGATVRVTAIDSATGTEVVVMGPATRRRPICSSLRSAS